MTNQQIPLLDHDDANKSLESLLFEYAGEHPHDEPYEGAGYCVCYVCQVLAPLAARLEKAVSLDSRDYTDYQNNQTGMRAANLRIRELEAENERLQQENERLTAALRAILDSQTFDPASLASDLYHVIPDSVLDAAGKVLEKNYL